MDLKAFSEQFQQQAREHKKELAAVRAEVAMLHQRKQTHGEARFYEQAYGDVLLVRQACLGCFGWATPALNQGGSKFTLPPLHGKS